MNFKTKSAAWINKLLSTVNLALIKRTNLNKHIQIKENHSEAVMLFEKHLKPELKELKIELFRRQNSVLWQSIDFIRNTQFFSQSLCCELCGHEEARNSFEVYETHCIFGGGRLIRYQCPQCDVIFGDEKMLSLTEQQLSQDYENHYKTYSEGDSTEQEKRAFFTLNPSRSGIYLNFGAGDWSKSVVELRQEGWNVLAYEPHNSASTNQNPDYVIRTPEELAKIKFDGIYTNNVLEHLRNPVNTLRFLSTLLTSDNAKMAHATPCFEYLYEFTRFHLFFYLGRSKALLAKNAELKIENFITDEEFMCLLLSKKKEQ